MNAPVATVERAKEIANDKKNRINDDIYIVMDAGNYYIENPIQFTQEDSGLNGNKIIYLGSTSGETVINGGKEVTDYEISEHLLTATVNDISDSRQLYVNGQPATMSSNEISVDDMEFFYENNVIKGYTVKKDVLPSAFVNETSAELLFVRNCATFRFPVTEIRTLADGRVALVLGEAFSYIDDTDGANYLDKEILINPGRTDLLPSVYLENCVCFTDSEGEFSFDRENKKITYYTKNIVDKVYVPVSEGLINICGDKTTYNRVKNLVFENITFENGAWNYPSEKGLVINQADRYFTAAGQVERIHLKDGSLIAGQITLDWCENIEFKNNTVKNAGATAIVLNEGVQNCLIYGNDISDTAAGAVRVGSHKHFGYAGEPLDTQKVCVGNTVENNSINNISLNYTASPAVTVYYANNTKITKNTITNTPYSGISLGWGYGSWGPQFCMNNEISCNRIENVMKKHKDGAHIYTNSQMTNTRIFGNYMKMSKEPTFYPDYATKTGWYGGLYIDDGSTNVEVYNNVVEECYNWLFVQVDKAKDENGLLIEDINIAVHDNYSDTEKMVNNSQFATIINAGSSSLAEAQKIISEAGAK